MKLRIVFIVKKKFICWKTFKKVYFFKNFQQRVLHKLKYANLFIYLLYLWKSSLRLNFFIRNFYFLRFCFEKFEKFFSTYVVFKNS